MKKFISKLTLVLFLTPLLSFGINDGKKQEKSKILKKEYNVHVNATVSLNNKYGNLNIITWNKNRVEITVKITAKGNSLSAVERKLSSVDVHFNGNLNLVTAKTVFEKSSKWNFWNNSNKVSYQINYTVKMPVTNNVKLQNDYGNILLNELNGKANISCDYGKIMIGKLNNSSNSISLDYCSKSTINYIKNGKVNVDYSKLTIDEANDIKLSTDYSTLTFGKLKGLDFNADYGSITVNEADNIAGNSDYTGVRLGKIYKNVKLNADYGSIKIAELVKGFQNAYIDSEYTGINIGTRSTNNFNFKIDLEYAGFRFDKSHVDIYKRIEKSSEKYYEGVYGKGKTNSTLQIKSEYGSVQFKQL